MSKPPFAKLRSMFSSGSKFTVVTWWSCYHCGKLLVRADEPELRKRETWTCAKCERPQMLGPAVRMEILRAKNGGGKNAKSGPSSRQVSNNNLSPGKKRASDDRIREIVAAGGTRAQQARAANLGVRQFIRRVGELGLTMK